MPMLVHANCRIGCAPMMAGPAMMGSRLDTTCSMGWAYLAPRATAVHIRWFGCKTGVEEGVLTRFEPVVGLVNEPVERLLVHRKVAEVEPNFEHKGKHNQA